MKLVSDAPNPNKIDVIMISDDEIPETPKNVTSPVLPKGCKRRKGVVVVRDFPFPPTRLQNPSTKVHRNRWLMAIRDIPTPTWLRSPFSGDSVHSMVPSDASESEPTEEETSESEPEEFSEYEYMEEVASNFISQIFPLNQIDSTTFEAVEFSRKLFDEAEDPDPLYARSDTEGDGKNNLKNSEKGLKPKLNAKESAVAVPWCRRCQRKRAFKSIPTMEISLKRSRH